MNPKQNTALAVNRAENLRTGNTDRHQVRMTSAHTNRSNTGNPEKKNSDVFPLC